MALLTTLVNTFRRIPVGQLSQLAARLEGYRLIDEDGSYVTSGDITLNATAVTDIASTQLTLNGAQSGDIVRYEIGAQYSAAAQFKGFEVYTYVSGSRVNPFGVGLSANLATLQGQPGWETNNVSSAGNLSSGARKVLVSGDISGGNVVVGVAYAGTSSTSRVLSANANTCLYVAAQLWRPPA